MTQRDEDRAQDQARAQLASIREMLAAASLDWDRLEELKAEELDAEEEGRAMDPDELDELDELRNAAGDYTSQEEAEEAIYNDPLSIQYRSGWASSPEDMQPEEFEILLCTGGPAVRILGELDFNGCPHRAWLEFQDWGTPWAHYYEEGAGDTLLDYASRLISL